jgi:hypothetical protein
MTMTTGDAQATIAAVATLRDITEAELRRIRKADGKVAVCDVIRAVTGQGATTCSKTWHRLTDSHPELLEMCKSCKFKSAGRGSHKETVVTDARGIVQIMMLLPGQAAAAFRKNAAVVIVRYLGGDPCLVEQIAAH